MTDAHKAEPREPEADPDLVAEETTGEEAATSETAAAGHDAAEAAADEQVPPVRESTEQVQVRVHRRPKYGVFMALGALIGAVGLWIFSSLFPSTSQLADGSIVDTSSINGMMIVVGFVVGAALGGLLALVLDRVMERRATTASAEHSTRARDTL